MSGILLKNISKSFNGKTIFENIDFTSTPGTIVAIKGKSGIGKSTLLHIIAGLELASSGQYHLFELNMSDKNLNELAKIRGEFMGYISQFSPMIPNLTVYENICIPWIFRKQEPEGKKAIHEHVVEISMRFGIKHLLNTRIEKLSGGELQRVGIIRALITNPKVIIADEPTSSLDDETEDIILEYFNEMKKFGIIVILATHSDQVVKKCDLVYHLSHESLQLSM